MNSNIVHNKKAKDMIFQCDICQKILSSKSNLENHVKAVHANTKDYVCKMCDFATTTDSGLRSHINHKHKPKKFPCNECDHVSQSSGNLERHKKHIHINIKDVRCIKCDMAFKTKGEMSTHVKRKHNTSSSDQATDKNYNKRARRD